MPMPLPSIHRPLRRRSRDEGSQQVAGAVSPGNGAAAAEVIQSPLRLLAELMTKGGGAMGKRTTRARQGPEAQRAARAGVSDGAAAKRATSELSDYDLVKRFLRGDHHSFEVLVERHRSMIYSFIYRMVGNQVTADDLFQEMWLKVLKHAHTYRPRAKFSTWAIQIARNTTLDHYKRENIRSHYSLDRSAGGTGSADEELRLSDLLADPGASPSDRLIEEDARAEVRRAIAALPEHQKQALILRMYHEMPYEEIAEVLDTPEGTAKYWVHEAMKHLADRLERRGVV